MRIKRTLERLQRATDDDLSRAARDIGHALAKNRSMRDFRSHASRIRHDDEYTQGYIDALLDVVAAHDAGIEA